MRQSPTEAKHWVCLDVQQLNDSRNSRGRGFLAPLWFMQKAHHSFSCLEGVLNLQNGTEIRF